MIKLAKTYKAKGILKGVEMSDGESEKGHWDRASLKIEGNVNGEAKVLRVSTFDEKDIDIANKSNGKQIEVKFTKSKDGQYNNLNKGGITVVGQGETPVKEEEEVAEPEAEPEDAFDEKAYKDLDEPEGKTKKTGTFQTKDGYWQDKFEFEKKTHYERQTSIVRQNSWTQAQQYIANCLKAIELGIIKKEEFSKEDLNLMDEKASIKMIAHQIEADILRKK